MYRICDYINKLEKDVVEYIKKGCYVNLYEVLYSKDYYFIPNILNTIKDKLSDEEFNKFLEVQGGDEDYKKY